MRTVSPKNNSKNTDKKSNQGAISQLNKNNFSENQGKNPSNAKLKMKLVYAKAE